MSHAPATGLGVVRIGTSGWHYKDWWGPFFPETIRRKDALSYYTTRFAATELNAPFYRLPTGGSVDAWYEQTPDGFRFAWKASKYITHWKRLKGDLAPSLALQKSRLARLRHKLGPVLYQLPPNLRIDRDRLAAFLKRLGSRQRCCMEFRHPSWYAPEIFDLLRAHDVSLCLSDHVAAPAPREVTAGWIYIRNHGPGGHYRGSYSDAALRDWARAIRRWQREGRDVWCFFDNDIKAAAPADAERLVRLVSASRQKAAVRSARKSA